VRQVDEPYVSMIRWLPCVVCGHYPHSEAELCDAAHVRYGDAHACKPITGIAIRPDDKWVVPLCADRPRSGRKGCHMRQHSLGDERAWWESKRIDPIRLCLDLRTVYEQGVTDRLSWPRLRDRMIEVIYKYWVYA
jgi:hypothetical protein